MLKNRRWAIIYTNADVIHWGTYVALGGDEYKDKQIKSMKFWVLNLLNYSINPMKRKSPWKPCMTTVHDHCAPRNVVSLPTGCVQCVQVSWPHWGWPHCHSHTSCLPGQPQRTHWSGYTWQPGWQLGDALIDWLIECESDCEGGWVWVGGWVSEWLWVNDCEWLSGWVIEWMGGWVGGWGREGERWASEWVRCCHENAPQPGCASTGGSGG